MCPLVFPIIYTIPNSISPGPFPVYIICFVLKDSELKNPLLEHKCVLRCNIKKDSNRFKKCQIRKSKVGCYMSGIDRFDIANCPLSMCVYVYVIRTVVCSIQLSIQGSCIQHSTSPNLMSQWNLQSILQAVFQIYTLRYILFICSYYYNRYPILMISQRYKNNKSLIKHVPCVTYCSKHFHTYKLIHYPNRHYFYPYFTGEETETQGTYHVPNAI